MGFIRGKMGFIRVKKNKEEVGASKALLEGSTYCRDAEENKGMAIDERWMGQRGEMRENLLYIIIVVPCRA